VKVNRKIASVVITGVAVVLLLAALPWAVQDTIENGRLYLFSQQFLDELPQRFTGPGRLRFLLQPLIAVLLGCRSGLGDARAGRPPYLLSLILGKGSRKELLRSGLATVRDLIAMGIVLDAVAQLLIYGELHPGAALLVGPILICVPYALARALSNRALRLMQHSRGN
jgi:hypothetical protein